MAPVSVGGAMTTLDISLYTTQVLAIACSKPDCPAVAYQRCKSKQSGVDVSPHKVRVNAAARWQMQIERDIYRLAFQAMILIDAGQTKQRENLRKEIQSAMGLLDKTSQKNINELVGRGLTMKSAFAFGEEPSYDAVATRVRAVSVPTVTVLLEGVRLPSGHRNPADRGDPQGSHRGAQD